MVIRLLLLIPLLFLVACLETEHTSVDISSEGLPEDQLARALGEKLYNNHCASCHAPIAQSNKQNASVQRITDAFATVPTMFNLRNQFSEEELVAIAIALSPRPDTPNTPEPPANDFDWVLYQQGIALYSQKFCASCHGINILESSKRDRSAFQILNAIGNDQIPQMHSIDLSEQQADALAYALGNTPPVNPNDPVASNFSFKVPLGTRYYLRSKMNHDFLINGERNDSADNSVWTRIRDQVGNKVIAFSGGCSSFDSESLCRNYRIGETSMQPTSSSVRAAYLNSACEYVLSLGRARDNALRNANISSPYEINETTVKQAWDRLIPTRPLPENVKSSAIELGAGAAELGIENRDAWSLILLNFCKSPHYEAL